MDVQYGDFHFVIDVSGANRRFHLDPLRSRTLSHLFDSLDRLLLEPPDQVGGVHLVFDSMTLKEALETVLHAELQAQDFYRQAARNAEQPDLADLYKELGGFEEHHVQWIETRFDELARTTA